MEAVKRLRNNENPNLFLDGNPLLSEADVTALLQSNTEKAKKASLFLRTYFQLVGDAMPNVAEIHLDPVEKRDVYKEYCIDMTEANDKDDIVSYSHFLKIWNKQFPHVRIREYKAVSGKCACCANLSHMRGMSKNPAMRIEISELHALHRITYMSERERYYERIRLAKNDPDNYMSIIMDGMAQSHTKLPWQANVREFTCPLDQHLQGILEHGQCFKIYRTFNNIRNDANSNIHCLLMHLEARYNKYGRLPDTIFIQADGGAENANKTMLAMCELLIHRGLTKEIYFNRLPVGHTHEDIDAKFGLIWKTIRTQHALTPQSYEQKLKEIFANTKYSFELHDIFVVPDYKSFLEDAIDPYFKNWSREGVTQLCFRFQAVPRSADYPLGVMTSYRAYGTDEVYEIVPSPNNRKTATTYCAQRVFSFWGPTEMHGDDHRLVGLSILQKLPDKPLLPAPFEDGFLRYFEETVRSVEKAFYATPNIVEEWKQFQNEVYPYSIDEKRYVDDYGLHVPLVTTLFRFMFKSVSDATAPNEAMEASLYHQYCCGRKPEDNPNIIDVLATHCVRFRKQHNLVILPRYAFPSSYRGMIDHEIIRRDTLLGTPNEKLSKLKKMELVFICMEYKLNPVGQKNDLEQM
jgi:hypothetical protein